MTQFTLAALFVSSLLNSLAPGPCILMVATRAMIAGAAAGFAVVAGVLTAISVYMAMAWAMLTFAVNLPDIFHLGIRVVGIGLLMYLSLRMFAQNPTGTTGQTPVRVLNGQDYRAGLLVGFSSPFNLIYMFGVLPQIVPASGVSFAEGGLIFGAVIVGTALPKFILTIAAARLGHFRDADRAGVTGRWVSRVSALVMVTFAGIGAVQILSDVAIWSKVVALN